MTLGTIIVFILALFGTPLFAIMGLFSLINHHKAEIDPQGIIINFYQLASQPLLQTLPLFAFAGYLLTHSGAPRRLVALAKAFLGWIPGGLVIVAVVACSLMTAFTGASGVTVIALAGLLPVLMNDRYDEEFSIGLITSGGSLGLLFAPSLPIILYGVVSETNIDHLFRAGVIPGLLAVLVLSLYGMRYAIRHGIPRQSFSIREVGRSAWEAKWEIPLPIVVIAGIYTGTFAISEAAVIATAYVLIVEVVIYRDIPLSQIGRIARETVALTGAILIILGMTYAVTNYLIDEQVPTKILEVLKTHIHSKAAFLIGLNIFLLVIACTVEIYAAIVLVVPLIMPIAAEYGIHPVHLGVIFLTNLGIGYIMPPLGLNLFMASIRFRQPVLKLYVACLGFFLCFLLVLLVVTYVPALSTMLIPADPGIGE